MCLRVPFHIYARRVQVRTSSEPHHVNSLHGIPTCFLATCRPTHSYEVILEIIRGPSRACHHRTVYAYSVFPCIRHAHRLTGSTQTQSLLRSGARSCGVHPPPPLVMQRPAETKTPAITQYVDLPVFPFPPKLSSCFRPSFLLPAQPPSATVSGPNVAALHPKF